MRPACWAPWFSMSVRADGGIYPCCVYNERLGTFTRTQDVVDVLRSDTLALLKDQLLRGEQPAGCRTCFLDEQAGSVSKRQKIGAHVEKERLFTGIAWRPVDTGVSLLEVSFSNLCNLTCVMCSSVHSSSWLAHEDARALATGLPRPPQRHVHRIPESEIESLAEFASSIDMLQVLGGEPAFDQRCRRFLRKLAETNPYCDVNIVTNGTLLDDDMVETLLLFQKGSISLSIDGVEKIFEFVRGAPFAKVDDLRRRLSGLSRDFLLVVNPALGLYNSLNLPEIIAWTQRLSDDLPHLQVELHLNQFVTSPSYLSPHLLPEPLRHELAESLTGALAGKYSCLNPGHLRLFLDYISTKSDPDRHLQGLAWKATAFYNQMRGFAVWEAEPRLLFLRNEP